MGILPQILSEIEEEENTINEVTSESYEEKRTYKFNFERGDFETNVVGEVLKTTTTREILKETVDKILHDARYKYLIYSDSHGNELDYILEQDYTQEELELELQRIYTEALLYNELISDVYDFEFEFMEDRVECSFIVEGKYGDLLTYKNEVIL